MTDAQHLNKLLNDFAQACAFSDNMLRRMAASKAIHDYFAALHTAGEAAGEQPAAPGSTQQAPEPAGVYAELPAPDGYIDWTLDGKTIRVGAVIQSRLIELIEQTAVRVGMKSLMNHGAASCVYTEGCNGVSQEHIIAFAREVALHCVAAITGESALRRMNDIDKSIGEAP